MDIEFGGAIDVTKVVNQAIASYIFDLIRSREARDKFVSDSIAYKMLFL